MNNFVGINGKGDFVLKVNGVQAGIVSFDENKKDSVSFDLTSYIASNPDVFSSGKFLEF